MLMLIRGGPLGFLTSTRWGIIPAEQDPWWIQVMLTFPGERGHRHCSLAVQLPFINPFHVHSIMTAMRPSHNNNVTMTSGSRSTVTGTALKQLTTLRHRHHSGTMTSGSTLRHHRHHNGTMTSGSTLRRHRHHSGTMTSGSTLRRHRHHSGTMTSGSTLRLHRYHNGTMTSGSTLTRSKIMSSVTVINSLIKKTTVISAS
ncbi:uncharacterized protein LOC105444966 isoform X1 [Strongylocentrotus purpuratus]|uniref:Uncharacterized protein n=1 Tax=Strongylocentrotus purpuratus TaxID=7668 RepID=A0A7M7HHW5_STRPU|nr:uncharacterized protein LOC105444966 isoform X1 [Strongylocentrotus purpuratus]|eukprot:XP_011678215.1 PREDICTED: uncharacterized protein LOC105444966 [Strongylocentrotus purpuratus]